MSKVRLIETVEKVKCFIHLQLISKICHDYHFQPLLSLVSKVRRTKIILGEKYDSHSKKDRSCVTRTFRLGLNAQTV